MSTKIQATHVNLIEVASQLATTATGLQQKVTESGKPIGVQVGQLLKKLPELKPLPSGINLFRMRALSVGGFEVDTLSVYLDETDNVVICQPDLEPLTGFEFVAYKSGIRGYAIVKHESGVELTIAMPIGDEHLTYLAENSIPGVDGEGMPPIEYLRPIPQPEIPPHSEAIPHGVELTIVGSGKRSKKFDTPLIDVKVPTGEVLKRVICNADMQRVLEKYGIGAKFKIVGKRPRVNRQGEPVTADGKVSKKNHAWVVTIADLQGTDFSDL